MFSTDDYFLQNGVYHYSQENLSEAHAWNKKRGERGIHVCVCVIIIISLFSFLKGCLAIIIIKY